MLIFEGSINNNGSIGDSFNGPLLCLIMEEASGCHDDGFSDLPIYIHTSCKVIIPRVNSGCDGSPCRHSGAAVHGELAVETTDTLVSEHGLLLAVVVAMHDEGELAVQRRCLSSSDELSSVDGDEVTLHSDISVIGENQCSVFHCDSC